MSRADQENSSPLPRIRVLDSTSVNRIAAGEVIERPASAIKELVENSIDAGATRIDVAYARGGRKLIRVADDGHGIPRDELHLAVSRHATSKTDGSDLLNIRSFGFRGEALPSMGAAGRLEIISRVPGSDAFSIAVDAGSVSEVRPAALQGGTVVELTELFHATPARLKFLRSDRSEARAIADALRSLAMADPSIGFALYEHREGRPRRMVLRLEPEDGSFEEAALSRLNRVIGSDFGKSAQLVNAARDGYALAGYCGLPTFTRGSGNSQYLFVNGRPVRDRTLQGALRGAYADLIPKGRYPVAALYINCHPELVDVNVHPGKLEVRFRYPADVRSLLFSALRHSLATGATQSSPDRSAAMIERFRPEGLQPHSYQGAGPSRAPDRRVGSPGGEQGSRAGWQEELGELPPWAEVAEAEQEEPADSYPLGAAKAQIHKTYIVSQTASGMAITDQHAAHERLVYEGLKRDFERREVESQLLLLPAIVEIPQTQRDLLLEAAAELSDLGLSVEPFGPGAVCVRSIPAILIGADCASLVRDIVDSLEETEGPLALQERINAVISSMACHGSVRSGKELSADDMNALLRQMEVTPNSGQCNHGRPTHIVLELKDIDGLFGRR